MALTIWHLSDTILQLKTQKRIKPTFKLKGDQSGIENVIDILAESGIVESNINADKIVFTSATNDYSQYMIGSDTNCLTPNKRIGFIYEADAEIY